MTIAIHDHALGVTRSFTRTERGELSVDFQRKLPSGGTIDGGATLTRNEDGSVTIDVTRTGPNGRSGERQRTFTAEEVASFKQHVRDYIEDYRDGPRTNMLV